MLLISNETFEKDKQKYLDLVDQEERVIVKLRKNKAYALTALSEEMVADFEVHAYFCQNDHSIQIEDMLVISNKTFEKDKQKYLDLIDQQERVIVKFRKTKAYALTALTKRETTRFISRILKLWLGLNIQWLKQLGAKPEN